MSTSTRLQLATVILEWCHLCISSTNKYRISEFLRFTVNKVKGTLHNVKSPKRFVYTDPTNQLQPYLKLYTSCSADPCIEVMIKHLNTTI